MYKMNLLNRNKTKSRQHEATPETGKLQQTTPILILQYKFKTKYHE